ncbi:MAG TPA: LuxR C-terminal-related transcriptional regulator [Gaiellaceae bacterium]
MTAGAKRPPKARPQRRIIERPRLIKLLDETDARTILLVAPAGYGKTTLARQWFKTLNGAIWVTLTPAHRDVAWLAGAVTSAIDTLRGGSSANDTVREHLKAHRNPQRVPEELGRAVAALATQQRLQWVVLDDTDEVAGSEAEAFLNALLEEAPARTLVLCRVRPPWIKERRLVYGDVRSIGREALAMTHEESRSLLGHSAAAMVFQAQAAGWPALISLAATTGEYVASPKSLPQDLHRYLAEELFARVPEDLRDPLLSAALLATLNESELATAFGRDAGSRLIDVAFDVGFSSSTVDLELHPLLREFLIGKLLQTPDVEVRVRAAVLRHLDNAAWDYAFNLILRFRLLDMVDAALERAYKPLARAGRLGTLAEFAAAIAASPTLPPASVDVASAELALGDGELDVARALAQRAMHELPVEHTLSSRAAAITGQVSYLLADFPLAFDAFKQALESATDDRDEVEALYGLSTSLVHAEDPSAAEAVQALCARHHQSAADLLRSETVRLAFFRVHGATETGGRLNLGVGERALAHADDPRARTSFTYTVAGVLAYRGEYAHAKNWLKLCTEDAEKYSLDFIAPYGQWLGALIALGQRRYADAERAVQQVEDIAARSGNLHHQVNASVVRARLMLQTGAADRAADLTLLDPTTPLIPHWLGELLATRALAHACSGDIDGCLRAAERAQEVTQAVDVHVLAQAAKAVASGAPADRDRLVEIAQVTEAWDPVVCALRASAPLTDALVGERRARPLLEAICDRANDGVLSRRLGLRLRSRGKTSELLSPRELEVLGLIARGFKNREISRALFIADSTTKVHVRHILEKLGVRTRAEAVARFRDLDH